jgi:hypothetical protein
VFFHLADETSLFEAEITGPAGGRGTDDHMIQHLDLQEPGAFGEPATQAGICLGRRRIPRWVVVLCGLNSYVSGRSCHGRPVGLGKVSNESAAAHNYSVHITQPFTTLPNHWSLCLVNHLHLFFIHPATVHFDFRESSVDLTKIRRRQLNIDCS